MNTNERLLRLGKHYFGATSLPGGTPHQMLDGLDEAAQLMTRGKRKTGPYWVGWPYENYVGTRIAMHEVRAFTVEPMRKARDKMYFYLGREADELPSIYGRMCHG